ncbi:hypothetical protein COBT_002863 [Conglomerata obtusa]
MIFILRAMFEFLHLCSNNATESNDFDIIETRMEKLMTKKNELSKANKIQYDVCIIVFNLQKVNAEFDSTFVSLCKNFLKKIFKPKYYYKQHFASWINNTNFLASFIHYYSEHKKFQKFRQSANKDTSKKKDTNKQGFFNDFKTTLDFKMPKNANGFSGLHTMTNEQSFTMFDVFCDNSQKCDFLFRSIEAKTRNIALKNVFIVVFDNDVKITDKTSMLNFLNSLNEEAYKAKKNANLEAFLIFNYNFLSVCFDFIEPKHEFAKSQACIESMYLTNKYDLCENLKTENIFLLNTENKMRIGYYRDGINMEDLDNINIIKPAYFFRNILIDEKYITMYSIEFCFYNVRYFFIYI